MNKVSAILSIILAFTAAPIFSDENQPIYPEVEGFSVDPGTGVVQLLGDRQYSCLVLDRIEIESDGIDTYVITPLMKRVAESCTSEFSFFRYTCKLPNELDAPKIRVRVRTKRGEFRELRFRPQEMKCATFKVDLERFRKGQSEAQEWPDSKDCKIKKLWIKDSRPTESGAYNTNNLIPLENLRNRLSKTPRILLDIPYVFTDQHNKNRMLISDVLNALNITSAEVFGLTGQRAQLESPNSVVKGLSVAACMPIFFEAALGFNLATSFQFFVCAASHGLARVASAIARDVLPSLTLELYTCYVPIVLVRHRGALWPMYVSLGCGFWLLSPLKAYVFEKTKVMNGHIYCAGSKDTREIGSNMDDYMRESFETSHLSKLCEAAY